MKARLGSLMLLLCTAALVRADQIDMQNGDRYIGTVVSMTSNTLVLRSEMLGSLKVPRNRIANISLGKAGKTGGDAVNAPATGNLTPIQSTPIAQGSPQSDLSAAIRQLGSSSNMLQQVQADYLATAGPEANQKYTEMMTGLMTGKLTANDLRAEAQKAADQLRDLKKDLGDSGDSLDGYLSILDGFLKETAPGAAPAAPTNATTPKTDFSATSPPLGSKK